MNVRPRPDTISHACAVALDGRGVLVVGAAGTGKSTLALDLMAFGAMLVADDRTCLAARRRGVVAWAPDAILGLIEARGVGLLDAAYAPPTPIRLVVDLDRAAKQRLPRPSSCDILNVRLPLIAGRDRPHIASIVLQVLKTGFAQGR